MLEVAAVEIIKSSISFAVDLLGERLKDINVELLERKREREGFKVVNDELVKLDPEEVSKILLSPNEKFDAKLMYVESETIKAVSSHIEYLRDWCSDIRFKDLQGRKELNQIYIDLDTYLMPMRTHFCENEKSSFKPLLDAVFESDCHSVILGQPGAGKTTSMKKLCSKFFSEEKNSEYYFPIMLRLRSLAGENPKDTITTSLLNLLKIDLSQEREEVSEENVKFESQLKEDILFEAIDLMRPIIIFDGFDEIQSHNKKEIVLEEIRFLTKRLKKSKIIITCRTGEFNFELENTNIFEISPLSDEQIHEFSHKWIDDKESADRFISDIHNSPFSDTAIKPLSLAHLCAIYERIGSIPDRPKTVYRKILGLMLDEWDEQRSIKRDSRYSKFESDRKFEFLAHLSYYLTTNGRTTTFSREELFEAYEEISYNFGLPEDQSTAVVNEIESHTGLFLQTGYETFEFSHKSLQEYLAAEYIVRLPSLTMMKANPELLASELAIATSISSNPSLYFSEIVLVLFGRGDLSDFFYNAFVSRLIQERPDFYWCEEVVLACFCLLSERLKDEKYIAFMESIIDGNDISVLLEYYQVVYTTNPEYIELELIKNHPQFKFKPKIKVPQGPYSELL